MVLAILEDAISHAVMEALQKAGYPLTMIDSTGGFLRPGKSTLIVGVDETDVDGLIELINQLCKPSANPFQKKSIIMVLGVDHFEQIQ